MGNKGDKVIDEFVVAVGQGSDRSFEEFFAASYGRLVGLLFAFLHDRAQAEDAVQDAFASALVRWPVVRGYHDPEAWVRTVAFRRAIDHYLNDERAAIDQYILQVEQHMPFHRNRDGSEVHHAEPE